ncbi:GNAT family N-acetyltransferase [Streptomyces sp. G2]|uniref:GNAT family N-acetyltransferase n=1 Tax=Streptomyces sp. G2 TaxID=1684471 RepID=UPI00202EB157|nr:GNAT family N-acetyltransferase [Streptomyces sp. G2]MCM1947066.1 GNAT family N-acetyltransferase [Streptomyces sp. G2]
MTAPEALIRPAVAADLEAVASLYAHYVRHTVVTFDETPPPVAHWRERLAELTERGLPFLVAEVAGEVAGYAYASPWRPKPAYRHSVENSVYLAPEATGRGLGTLLMRPLVAACARAGAHQMIAVVADSGTEASQALHRRLGFTEVGRLRAVGHKHGRWVDTVLFQLPLTDGRGTAGVTGAP